MENNYYIPLIEEFAFGLEYEYLERHTERENFYEPQTITKYSSIDLFDSEIKSGLIRVKYLDKEDIESFQIPLDEWFTSKHKYQGVYKVEAQGLQVNPRITIKAKDFIRDGSGNYVETIKVYRLNIKNKTEFGKLLKQSNIL